MVAALLYLVLFILPPLLIPSGATSAPSPTPPVSPPAFADVAKAESDARGNLVAALGVVAVLIGGMVGVASFLAGRRQSLETMELSRRTLEVTQRGQMAERFTKAIEQLGRAGNGQLAIRLGALQSVLRRWSRALIASPTLSRWLSTLRSLTCRATGPPPAGATT